MNTDNSVVVAVGTWVGGGGEGFKGINGDGKFKIKII